MTKTGKPCRAWVDSKYFGTAIPDNPEAAKNYCRSPDVEGRDGGAWCYYDAYGNWDYCSCSKLIKIQNYLGFFPKFYFRTD